MPETCELPQKTCLYGIILYDVAVVSKTVSVAAAVVVTIMISVVIAASLGTQDDMPPTPDLQPPHAPSETPGTVNGTSDTLTEPQDSASQTTEPPISPAPLKEFETVDVGIMLPSAGASASHGNDNGAAVRLGAADFNAYLEEIGASWRMNPVFDDAQTNPASPLERIQSLDSKGVKFVLGPESSAEILGIKSYVDANGMVLISPSSTSPSLAIDDGIFRLAPNPVQQGKTLALLFEQEGIEAVIPLYRGDARGADMYKSTKNSFEALGGVMDDGIFYSTVWLGEPSLYDYSEKPSFSPNRLSDLVEKYSNKYSADKVAILVIGFSETAYLLDIAASFDRTYSSPRPELTFDLSPNYSDNLDSVRWFSSDSLSMDSAFLDHLKASAFAQNVDFVSARFAPSTNDVYERVRDYLADFEGLTPSVSAFSSYDSVWVLGKTILETGSTDPLAVRDAITDVAATHTGAIGTVNLNEFGDFATSDYDLWSISEGAWHKSGHFSADNSTFDFASDFVTDRDMMKSDLPKIVNVGLLITQGHFRESEDEYMVMAYFGLHDFNNYLEEIGASWRMNFVLKDAQGDPVRNIKLMQSLDSEGIKLVLGPLSSAEVRHVKSYADSNDMVLISPTSSSPSLAVADSIFRMVPDDTWQSKALSLLFEREGIEAVVPIYRGDVWGDDLYESTRNSFEAIGGVMDDGIRYSPDVTVYSTEANLLSSLVDRYVAKYSADKVAVLMIGFHETVHLLDSAASFDNLHDVRWFGSDGSSRNPTLSDDPTASAFLQDVDFVSTLFDTPRNDVYAHMHERFMKFSGRTVGNYHFPIYDSVWVLGKTILETDSIDPLTVRDSIVDVASTHTGAIGTINLNEFGDFATPSYGLWSIRDGAWYKSGHFDGDDGTFSFT